MMSTHSIAQIHVGTMPAILIGMNTIKASHKDIVATLVTGRSMVVSFDTAFNMIGAGLLNAECDCTDMVTLDASFLTDLGRTVGEARAKENAARRSARNAAVRAHNATMSGLGLRRTPHGWE